MQSARDIDTVRGVLARVSRGGPNGTLTSVSDGTLGDSIMES